MSDDSPATRTDLAELGAELLATKTELKSEMDSLRQEFRHQGILFEQLVSKVDAFGEGLVGLREHVTEEIRALRKELSSRISLLEEVVRKNSADIRDMKGDLQEVKADVADLRRRFDRLERETDLEKRVAEVEKRLGIR